MGNFDYILKRSARKTISISIQSDNSIVVRCPQKTKIERVEQFLEEKRDWIEKHLSKNGRRNEQFSAVINGETMLIKGEEVPFKFENGDNLKKFYVDNFGEQFSELLNDISARANLAYSKVSFRDYKSRWGCCNAKKELTFNYKLLMLPKNIWEYVIIHELCHTKHMNHSAAFWNCVAALYPNYNNAVRELKRYSFLCTLY